MGALAKLVIHVVILSREIILADGLYFTVLTANHSSHNGDAERNIRSAILRANPHTKPIYYGVELKTTTGKSVLENTTANHCPLIINGSSIPVTITRRYFINLCRCQKHTTDQKRQGYDHIYNVFHSLIIYISDDSNRQKRLLETALIHETVWRWPISIPDLLYSLFSWTITDRIVFTIDYAARFNARHKLLKITRDHGLTWG